MKFVADPSALLAILFGEQDASDFEAAINGGDEIYLSTVGLLELSIVCDQRKRGEVLDTFLGWMRPRYVPVDQKIAEIARKAYQTYGRGRHPAKLNLGDCISYATARHLRMPLLYKGDDFGKTDMKSVL